MPKRPDTVQSVLLALEILKRIPRPGKISAPELHAQLKATEFARDLRTVQRQLDMLSQHFDVERDDRSKPYGYRWKERAEGISLPSMTPQEAMLLALAQEHLRNLLPVSMMNSMYGLFSAAQRMLSGAAPRARREKAWLQKVRVVSPTLALIPPDISPQIFERVSNALYGDKVLEVEYRNARGVITKGTVFPLGLAQQGPRLFLVCQFERFKDARTLALHRLLSAEIIDREFQRPRSFDLRKYDDEGRFGFGNGTEVKLSFRIRKEEGAHLLESPISADQQHHEVGPDYEISGTVVESAHLIWWLRHFGSALTRVRPSSIAKQL